MIVSSDANMTAFEGVCFLYISSGMKTLLLLAGAALVIVAGSALTLWLACRKKRRRKHKPHPHHWQLPPDAGPANKHPRRRRHRGERPMNPTLANGGELPKPRSIDPASGSDRPTSLN